MLLFFRLRLHHGPSYLRSKIFFWIIFYFFCEKNVVSLLKLIALYEIKYVIRVSIRLIVTITIIIIIIHENKRNWIFTYDLFAVITREESDASHIKTIKESNSLTNAKANISVKNLLCCIHVFVAFFVAVYEWKNPVHERGNQAF